MERVVETASDAGITARACLATRTAVPFYRRVGFQGDAEVDVKLDAGITFPAIRMSKDL